jgi:hypothetical protein
MALSTPEAEVFYRLRAQVNGVSAVRPLAQPIGIAEENYAKTVSRHPTANRFSEEQGRFHSECQSPVLSTLHQRSPYCRAVKMGIFLASKSQTLPNSQLFITSFKRNGAHRVLSNIVS